MSKMTRINRILAIVCFFAVAFTTLYFIGEMPYQKMVSKSKLLYIDTPVSEYSAKIRKWHEQDVYGLFESTGNIERTEEETNGMDDANPIERYESDSNEQVLIIEPSLIYIDSTFPSEWNAIVSGISQSFITSMTDSESESRHFDARINEALSAVQKKVAYLDLGLVQPRFVIDATSGAIEDAKIALFNEYNLVIEVSPEPFVMFDIPMRLDGLECFSEARLNHSATAPGMVAVVSGGEVKYLQIYADYLITEQIESEERGMQLNEVIELLPQGKRRIVKAAAYSLYHYVVTQKEEENFTFVPCWSFYGKDGEHLLDVNAINGRPI